MIVGLRVVGRQRGAELRVRLRVVVRYGADGDTVEREASLHAVDLRRWGSDGRPVDLVRASHGGRDAAAPSRRGDRLLGAGRSRRRHGGRSGSGDGGGVCCDYRLYLTSLSPCKQPHTVTHTHTVNTGLLCRVNAGVFTKLSKRSR